MEEVANERTPILSVKAEQQVEEKIDQQADQKAEETADQQLEESLSDFIDNIIDQRNCVADRHALYAALSLCRNNSYTDLKYELILKLNKILVRYANSISYDEDIEQDIYICKRLILEIESRNPTHTQKFRDRTEYKVPEYSYFSSDRYGVTENYQGLKEVKPTKDSILRYKFIGKKVKQTMAKYKIKQAEWKHSKEYNQIVYNFACSWAHLAYIASYIYWVLDPKSKYSTDLKIMGAIVCLGGLRSLLKNLLDPRLINYHTKNRIYRWPANIPSWVNMILYNITRLIIFILAVFAIVNDPGHYDIFKIALFVRLLLFIDAPYLLMVLVFALIFLFIWCACCCIRAQCTKQIKGRVMTFIAQRYMSSGSLDEVPNAFHETTCAICLGEFSADEQNQNNIQSTKITKLSCNHVFHADCIKSAMKYSLQCPTCKHKMI